MVYNVFYIIVHYTSQNRLTEKFGKVNFVKHDCCLCKDRFLVRIQLSILWVTKALNDNVSKNKSHLITFNLGQCNYL